MFVLCCSRFVLCDFTVNSGREVDKLFQTADVTRVIGHERNSADINNSARRLSLPEPLGERNYDYVQRTEYIFNFTNFLIIYAV